MQYYGHPLTIKKIKEIRMIANVTVLAEKMRGFFFIAPFLFNIYFCRDRIDYWSENNGFRRKIYALSCRSMFYVANIFIFLLE